MGCCSNIHNGAVICCMSVAAYDHKLFGRGRRRKGRKERVGRTEGEGGKRQRGKGEGRRENRDSGEWQESKVNHC